MTRIDKSISLLRANVLAIGFALPLALIAIPPYIALWGNASLRAGSELLFGNLLIFLAVLIVGVVVHELLHGVTWQVLSGEWDTVEYGVKWRMLTPYAHLKATITAGAYRVGVWMLGLVVGIVPLVLGLVIGNGAIFWFGLLFTWSAGGDAMILWMLRDIPDDALVEDHPERAGCYVYRPENA